jgi:hypothetical protein
MGHTRYITVDSSLSGLLASWAMEPYEETLVCNSWLVGFSMPWHLERGDAGRSYQSLMWVFVFI